MKIELDTWLTAIFEHDVYKVTPSPASLADLSAFAIHSRGCARAFYYVKIFTEHIAVMNQLVSLGFRVVDVNLSFEREPDRVTSLSTIVREASPQDASAVLAIASSCFVYSRFHLDPLISRDFANKIKREWVANYFRGERGEKIFVAEIDNQVVGFNAVLKMPDSTRVIDLIGVDLKHQGHGVGKSLVTYFVNDSHGGYARLRVGTQVANRPSMNLYTSCGFKAVGASYVLHAHFKNGEIIQ